MWLDSFPFMPRIRVVVTRRPKPSGNFAVSPSARRLTLVREAKSERRSTNGYKLLDLRPMDVKAVSASSAKPAKRIRSLRTANTSPYSHDMALAGKMFSPIYNSSRSRAPLPPAVPRLTTDMVSARERSRERVRSPLSSPNISFGVDGSVDRSSAGSPTESLRPSFYRSQSDNSHPSRAHTSKQHRRRAGTVSSSARPGKRSLALL